MQFIDTHAHLPLLTHAPGSEIVDRAGAAGIVQMVTVATELDNWVPSRALAEQYDHIYFTLGVHPHQAQHWGPAQEALSRMFGSTGPAPKCVGLGETGLDFYYEFCDPAIQIAALEGHLTLASQWNLPLVLHCRDAFTELFATIRRTGLPPSGGVMHCFTGTEPDAKAALDLGLFISFSGILTFRNAQDLRDVARRIPLNRIVLETDCPYLAPVPYRGKPNEPAWLPQTAACLAQTLGITLEEVAAATTANARTLFGLPHPNSA